MTTQTPKKPKKSDEEKSESKDKDPSKLLKKLKSVCTNCTKASIMVYLRLIKRLYKLIEDGTVPLTGDWLGKKELMEKYRKLPLKQRRHLSTGAVKASKMYKRSSEKWEIEMYKDASKYDRERGKNKKSDKERASWPKQGYKAVKKAANEQWKRVKLLLPGEPNLKTLYKYQMFLALKLFSEVPFRNTFASFSIKKTDGNYIKQPPKGNFTFIVNDHKTSKKTGPREVTLSRASTMAVRKFLKYRARVPNIQHDFLFSNKRGDRMTKATFGKAVHRVTKELLGKSFGSRLIRVLAATEMKPEIDKAADLANKMLHSQKQGKAYTRSK